MMHSCSERRMIIWSLCLIFCLSNSILVTASSAKHLCLPDQRDALWEFKNEFSVESRDEMKCDTTTEKWRNNTDCCSWDGVHCDTKTGNVVELDLSGCHLYGPLRSNSSLFKLQHLHTLHLQSYNFRDNLPDSIGNLRYLRSLSLVDCNIMGVVPSSIGNLSYLTHLYLSSNYFYGELPDSMSNLNKLTKFYLGSNEFRENFPRVLLNLSSLTIIDLGYNEFRGMLPSNMSSLSKLVHFNINENSFSGTIPSSLFMIPSLIELDLLRNYFSGPLEIGNISSHSKLQLLYIGENEFSGPIPISISKLVTLQDLDLSYWNTRKGIVDFRIFSHLKSLWSLNLSGINMKNISSNLHLPSSMDTLILSSCNISEFPKFLQKQTSLVELDISANQIEGQVPQWLWRLPQLQIVNISENSFSGFEGSADVIQRSRKLYMLDMSSNTLQDPFPLLPDTIRVLFGSYNRFSGEIPRSICEFVHLVILVLSNNNFNGSIPRCFDQFKNTLSVLHLRNNNLSGILPEEAISIGLRSLDVGGNRLSGELPKSLINCTELEFLNVEENRINDTFPFWLVHFLNLQILVLRSNEFHGPISPLGDSLSFPKLRIFDISENHFTGVLPSDYFTHWTAMSSVLDTSLYIYGGNYHKSVALVNKGLSMELVVSGFTKYKTIDVSGNRLEGEIPESIGLLEKLIVLNMSNNAFTGRIPPSLSNLFYLQSLDLSQNRLSGEIPSQLGNLAYLALMNFSYNMLEGPIPQFTHIHSQNSSSFAENPGLCGVPLQETCGKKEEETEQDEKEEILSCIAAAVGLGYALGVVCGLTIAYILTLYNPDWFMRTVT